MEHWGCRRRRCYCLGWAGIGAEETRMCSCRLLMSANISGAVVAVEHEDAG